MNKLENSFLKKVFKIRSSWWSRNRSNKCNRNNRNRRKSIWQIL